MATKPTIVLVPGAWHFPSCFHLVVEQLKAKDYPVQTVAHASVFRDGDQLPQITSHQEDAQAIKDVVIPLIQEGKEVIVFCHSYGGAPTTEALVGLGREGHINENGGVLRIIYCAAYVPREGESVHELNENNSDGWTPGWIGLSDDFSRTYVHPDHAIHTFYADVEPELAVKMNAELGLMASASHIGKIQHCAWREIPSTYILCEEDKAILAHFQDRMVKAAGISDIVRLPGASHSPFLSRPGEIVAIIERVSAEQVLGN